MRRSPSASVQPTETRRATAGLAGILSASAGTSTAGRAEAWRPGESFRQPRSVPRLKPVAAWVLGVVAGTLASVAVASAVTASAAESGRTPELVRDINPLPGNPSSTGGSFVGDLEQHTLLVASSQQEVIPIWAADAHGNFEKIAESCGLANGLPGIPGLAAAGKFWFAAAEPGPCIRQPWVTDGTREGTRRLTPTRGGRFLASLEQLGMVLFAAERDGVSGLWLSDGTPQGTRPLALDGPDGWPRTPAAELSAASGARLALVATFEDGIGPRLWATDGSDGGTRVVTDATQGGPLRIRGFHALGDDRWLFTGREMGWGREAWVTDGTPAGTFQLADTVQSESPSGPIAFATVGDLTYWVAIADSRRLWATDGTAGGTAPVDLPAEIGGGQHPIAVAVGRRIAIPVRDSARGSELGLYDAESGLDFLDLCPGQCPSLPLPVLQLDGRWVFTADDGTHGRELWATDGTREGTRMLADLCPGSCSPNPWPLRRTGSDRGYFALGGGRELWTTDGTPEGTVRLTDPDRVESVWSLGRAGELTYFIASDEAAGAEPWRTDGTPEGTRLAADLTTGRDPGVGSHPARLTRLGAGALFTADDGEHGRQPWYTDGSEQGTRPLGQIVFGEQPSGDEIVSIVTSGERAYFLVAYPPDRLEVWTYDLTSDQTLRLLAWTETSALHREPHLLTPFPGGVFIRGAGGLWRSDGTVEGTVPLRPLTLATRAGAAYFRGRLYFSAGDSPQPPGFGLPVSDDLEVWVSDGTELGTEQWLDLDPLRSSRPRGFTVAGGLLYFAARQGNQARLWVSDGSTERTEAILRIPRWWEADFQPIADLDGRLLFTIGGLQRGLWITDGTPEGTVQLSSQNPIAARGAFAHLDGQAFFLEDRQIRATDGRVGDLARVDLVASGHQPTWIRATEDRLLIWTRRRESFAYVYELWESDGRPGGHRRLGRWDTRELFLDPALVDLEHSLLFSAPDPVAGVELIRAGLTRSEGDRCLPAEDRLCLLDGQITARVDWRDPRSGTAGTGTVFPFAASPQSGAFSFFSPERAELGVKMLDGGSLNERTWLFHAPLTDVEYWLEVFDHRSGRRRLYHRPPFDRCGGADIEAFPSSSPSSPAHGLGVAPALSESCDSPQALRLLGGRFRAEVVWRDPRSGEEGVASAAVGSELSGFFWFFRPDNFELAVKVLDGRELNGRFWVFHAPLTDLEYTLTVTDTATGARTRYEKPGWESCGQADTTAF